MNSEVLTPLLNWLDLAGVAIFALTGALVAAKERQTFVTLGFFSLALLAKPTAAVGLPGPNITERTRVNS